MKNTQRRIVNLTGLSLGVVSASVLITTLVSRTGIAQGCSNFWVNPQTGVQQCLDSLASPSSGSTSSTVMTGSSTPNQGFASSATVNSQYVGKTFTTLPANQLQVRTPIPASLPQVSTTAATIPSGTPGAATSSSSQVAPSSAGTAGVPFTGSRVLGGTANVAQADHYNKTGKLYMAFGGTTYNYVCSASLIGRSLLLTAAHCVHDYGRGNAGWATKVKFVPAKDNASEPFGFYESTRFIIPSVYFNGTDTCSTRGVVCNNDIALVALGNQNNSTNNSLQAGTLVGGWYDYGWNNFSFFTPDPAFQSVFGNKPFAAITQLGYPASHDNGLKIQLTTGIGGYALSGNLKNTWLGSAMTGGSSGGPWLVNFGINAAGADYGLAANRNAVVGVTSWGYTSASIKLQGASSFGQNVQFPNAAYGTRGAGNIGALVNAACDGAAPWNLQAQGRCR